MSSRFSPPQLAWILVVAACAHAPAKPAPAAVPTPIEVPRAELSSEWRDGVLYFVIVDRFADGDPTNDAGADPKAKGTFHGGDLKGLTQQLDEIASLGVTAIWITPLVKQIDGFVTGAGFPDWGYHGYWADDFTRLDPRFGSEADLKAFVDAAHARGLKVLLDVVYNHAGYGSCYIIDLKIVGWLRIAENGGCGKDDLTSCLSGLPDFRTEDPIVANYLLDAQLGWAKRSGVDGFRLDTLKHVDHPFWKEHRRRVRAELPAGFFLLGEVWGSDAVAMEPWFSTDEVDAGFDFSFQGTTLAYVQGRGRTVAFDRYLASRFAIRPGYLTAPYLSSHDVKGALLQLGGDVEAFKLCAALELTSFGLPTIFYGEEVARPGGDWPDNRSDMPWGDRDVLPGKGLKRDENLRAYYQRLIAARRTHKALSRGTHRGVATDGDLYAFAREDAESKDAVLVVVNRAKEQGRLATPRLAGWGERVVVDLLSGRELAGGGELSLDVPPRTAMILAAK